MKSSSTKEEYLRQFDSIIKGVEDSVAKQERDLSQRERQVDDLKSVNQNLVDEQRRYFQAVKDFQLECQKNEWMLEKLESLNQGEGAARQ